MKFSMKPITKKKSPPRIFNNFVSKIKKKIKIWIDTNFKIIPKINRPSTHLMLNFFSRRNCHDKIAGWIDTVSY